MATGTYVPDPNDPQYQQGTGVSAPASGATPISPYDPGSLQGMEYQNYSNLNPNIQANPQTNAAMMQALGQYGTLASAGGLDPQAIAAQQQQLQQSNIGQNAQQGGITGNAINQGNLNSGGVYAQRLGTQQMTAQPGALAASGIAQGAQQNTMSALGNYGGLAGNMNQQQFNQGQTNFGNALNLANSKNNVLTGFQNTLVNQNNQNAALSQAALNAGGGTLNGVLNLANGASNGTPNTSATQWGYLGGQQYPGGSAPVASSEDAGWYSP